MAKRSSSSIPCAEPDFGLSPQDEPQVTNEENTGTIVQFSLDLNNPPPLTEDEHNQLRRLRSMTDGDIDYSNFPPQTGIRHWSRPGLFGGPAGTLRLAAMKEKVLILDEDVAASLGNATDATPEKLNAVLREYAETHRKTA